MPFSQKVDRLQFALRDPVWAGQSRDQLVRPQRQPASSLQNDIPATLRR